MKADELKDRSVQIALDHGRIMYRMGHDDARYEVLQAMTIEDAADSVLEWAKESRRRSNAGELLPMNERKKTP